MNKNDLRWWISSWEALKAIGGGISKEMEIELQNMKKELLMKESNDIIKEKDGSFTINVKGKSEISFKEPIPFLGIYEENMENEKLAIASNSTFKYSSGADVQKVWKAYGWIPPSTIRNDYLFKANRIASGLSK